MAEVQQTSDATFRLFDWNRKDAQGKSRPLHVEESMASIHWSQGPVTPVRAGAAAGRRQVLVECRYFRLESVQESGPFVLGGTGRLQAAVVLSGRGRWSAQAGGEEFATGQTWVLPARMPAAECRPDGALALLLVTLV
jgi:mannose-6-phosphate isomerase